MTGSTARALRAALLGLVMGMILSVLFGIISPLFSGTGFSGGGGEQKTLIWPPLETAYAAEAHAADAHGTEASVGMYPAEASLAGVPAAKLAEPAGADKPGPGDWAVAGPAQAVRRLSRIRSLNGKLYVRNWVGFDIFYVSLLRRCKVGTYRSYYWGHLAVNLQARIQKWGNNGAVLSWNTGLTPYTFGNEAYIRKQADRLIRKLNLRKGKSSERAFRLWLYIQENVSYGGELLQSQTADSFFRDKRTVCAGAAAAYAYIMNRVGIPCIPLPMEGVDHECCYIRIGRKWYIVDPTPPDRPAFPDLNRIYGSFLTTNQLYSRDVTTSPSFSSQVFQKAFPASVTHYPLAKLLGDVSRDRENAGGAGSSFLPASGTWIYAMPSGDSVWWMTGLSVPDEAIWAEQLK